MPPMSFFTMHTPPHPVSSFPISPRPRHPYKPGLIEEGGLIASRPAATHHADLQVLSTRRAGIAVTA